MKYRLTTCFIVGFFSLCIWGQISTEELPPSWEMMEKRSSSIPVVEMPRLDMTKLQKEDEQDEADNIPPRFGELQPTNISLNNAGVWTTLQDGSRLWRVEVYSPDALSLNFLYDQYYMPAGGKLFVYSTNKEHTIGAFTDYNNREDGEFATGLIYSNRVIIEYYEPLEVKGEGELSISYVVSGYRYIQLPQEIQPLSFGGSGSCQININCSEGASWQNEKRAVPMIIVNGNRYCTGSLLNNTSNNFEPLFLTADHCLGGWANNYMKYDAITNPNLPHYSFYWMYESPGCSNGSSQPAIKSTVGATILANGGLDKTDFALLKLKEDPRYLSGITPYYLGWDCTGATGTGGVGIHHPAGDVKKIATHNRTPTSTSVSGSGQNYWQVYWSQTTNGHSVTEGGSSGSPLINNSRRVIGQLYGGSNVNCANPAADNAIYGKFHLSWTGNNNSDRRRRLKDWLDPNGVISSSGGTWSAITYSDKIPNQTITGSKDFYGVNLSASSVVIKNGARVNFVAKSSIELNPGFSIEGGAIVNMTINTSLKVAPYAMHEDEVIAEDIVLSADILQSLDEALSQNDPNPFTHSTRISCIIPEEASASFIEIYNTFGKSVQIIPIKEKGKTDVYVEGYQLTPGIYMYSLIVDNKVVDTKRIIVVQ